MVLDSENIINDSNNGATKNEATETPQTQNNEITIIDTSLEQLNVTDDEAQSKPKRKKAVPIVEDENGEKPIKLTRAEKRKLRVINRLIAGEINGPKAAKLLKITTRQVRNLKRQVLEQGEAGIIHKNRFYKPVNTYDEDLRKQIASIYRKEFKGMNFTEFAKIMQERGYNLSRSTIYNILRENRIRSPQRKKKKRKKITPTVDTTVTQLVK